RRFVLCGQRLCRLGGEDDAPGRRARTGTEACTEDVAGGSGVDLGVQMLHQTARLDAQQRLVPGDRAGLDQIDRHAHRGTRTALDRLAVEYRDLSIPDSKGELMTVAETMCDT